VDRVILEKNFRDRYSFVYSLLFIVWRLVFGSGTIHHPASSTHSKLIITHIIKLFIFEAGVFHRLATASPV